MPIDFGIMRAFTNKITKMFYLAPNAFKNVSNAALFLRWNH
jgi:hypothetical protein